MNFFKKLINPNVANIEEELQGLENFLRAWARETSKTPIETDDGLPIFKWRNMIVKLTELKKSLRENTEVTGTGVFSAKRKYVRTTEFYNKSDEIINRTMLIALMNYEMFEERLENTESREEYNALITLLNEGGRKLAFATSDGGDDGDADDYCWDVHEDEEGDEY
jgi:hypothetical protein